jgi:hypothetical protein
MALGDKLYQAIVGSTQGKVATAGYVVLLVCIVISVIYQNQQKDIKPEDKLSPLELTLVFGLLFVAYILAIYSINCMVLGVGAQMGCGVWAWLNAIIVVVFAIAVLFSTFYGKKLMMY